MERKCQCNWVYSFELLWQTKELYAWVIISNDNIPLNYTYKILDNCCTYHLDVGKGKSFSQKITESINLVWPEYALLSTSPRTADILKRFLLPNVYDKNW